MVQTVARTRFGPETFEVSEAVTGGQLVEPSGTDVGTVKPAAANSVEWLGVALYDALPAGTSDASTINGFPALNTGTPRPEVAVAWHGVFKLTATGAVNFGDLVYPAAAGAVSTTAGTGRAVGQCVQPDGIASGGQVLIRLF